MLIVDRLISGIKIIRKYDPDADIGIGHEVIFFGSYELFDEMTLDEQQCLQDWGWHEYEESFAFNFGFPG